MNTAGSGPSRGRWILAAILAAGSGCAGGGVDFTAFPVAPHRPADVQEESLRVDRAIEEFLATRGLEVDTGARLRGVVVTRWAPVAGIENGDPPLAECPALREDGDPSEYRARYRITDQTRGGRRSLFVEAHWEILRPEGLDRTESWAECRSTGVFERAAQDRILLRARMLSGSP